MSERYFTTSSGNVARFQLFEKEERVGVACTFKRRPSEADQREFVAFFLAEQNLPPDTPTDSALAGEVVPGKARQTDQIRKFLKTGEVPK